MPRSDVKLPAEVAEKYQLKNWTTGPLANVGKFGTVNINKLSLVQAERLVARGFPYLVARPKKEEAPKSSTNKK